MSSASPPQHEVTGRPHGNTQQEEITCRTVVKEKELEDGNSTEPSQITTVNGCIDAKNEKQDQEKSEKKDKNENSDEEDEEDDGSFGETSQW